MSSTPVTVRNAVDTSAAEHAASRTWAGSTRLRLRSGAGNVNYAYIRFSRPFPLGVNITSATLKVYGYGSWPSATRNMTVKRVNAKWVARNTNWNNKPSVTGAGVTVQKTGTLADETEWSFDVTSHMQLIADGSNWYGWRIELDDTTLRKLYSANAGKKKPTLEVTYTTAPDAPTGLEPSSGKAVSVSHPTVSFDFIDDSGDETLDAVKVQINSTDTFTSPTFDSGWVTSAVPQLDLSTTAYAGISAGTTQYWRVKVRDGAGLESAWSESTSFSRTAKGTLTITNPAASPSNYVEEATPPITWTFSGTQRMWQVLLFDVDGNRLDNSGRQEGTANSYTLPKKIINDNETYTVVVKVWDTVDRIQTPGDTAFVRAERSFDFQKDAATTAVTGLTATDLTPLPGVQLDWSRSTAPDEWAVFRDGTHVDTVDAADLLVSGTSYRFTDRGVSPRTSHTWEVRAVVNGKTSGTNPSVSKTIEPTGIWLIDEDNDIYVAILGQDPGSWSMGEDAEMFAPLGARKPVRITQSMRGFEGSITGVVADFNSVTAQTYENRLWRIKKKPGKVFRLILADKSIPVVIGNLVVSPTPNADLTKNVSFDFWQVDEFTFRANL